MKTIKFTLLSILFLFISVLLIREVVISLQYITTSFTNPLTKDIHNFSLTFSVQAIILAAISFVFLSFMFASMQLTHKYFNLWIQQRKIDQLHKHLADSRYEELVSNLRKTQTNDLKQEYIEEYLRTRNNRSSKINKIIENWLKETRLAREAGEQVHKDFEQYKPTNTSSTFPVNGIDFIPIDKNIHKE